MRRKWLVLPFAALVLTAATSVYGAEVGEKAPELTPSKWLNTKVPVSWKDLAGRVILIEKWATW